MSQNEKEVMDLAHQLTVAESKFDKIFQILFWYDSIPRDDEELRSLVWQANRLHREISGLKEAIKQNNARQSL